MNEETITITKKEYEELQKDSLLPALFLIYTACDRGRKNFEDVK